jgi:threonine dehydrogenase-like Zn-dependent dehydrogenase
MPSASLRSSHYDMFATNDFSDKFPVSWEKKPTTLPLTPPPETVTSAEWSSTIHSCQINKSGPTEDAPVVAVIGVGYVGTHLVEAFAHHYKVVAYDLSDKRLRDVAEQLGDLPIQFTSSASDLAQASHVLISVPTVLNDDKTIDTTYLRSAIATVEKHVKDGSTVVVESSVAVGMTRQLVGPLMASKKLKIGMSPEVSYPIFHTIL